MTLPSSSETQAHHFFSPWFPHQRSPSERLGQAGHSCGSEKASTVGLDLIFYCLRGWVNEWQPCTPCSAATSQPGFLSFLKKVKRPRTFSSVYPTHTLRYNPQLGLLLFAPVTWETLWRFSVCFVTNCTSNHFLFSASDHKHRTFLATPENVHLNKLKKMKPSWFYGWQPI